MKQRLLFLIKYFLFWLVLFLSGKIIFLLYEHDQSFQLPFADWFRILSHGFRLDLSTAAYFMVIPVLIMAVTVSFDGKKPHFFMNILTLPLIVVFLLITLVDLEIYKYWGCHLDSAPLRFLSTPGDTLASSSIPTVILYFLAFFLLAGSLSWFYLRKIAASLKSAGKGKLYMIPVFFVIEASLIIPIRGGFDVSVINSGSAFFHRNMFANHAGVNVIWNFGQSIVEGKEFKNPFIAFKEPGYENELKSLYVHKEPPVNVLNTDRPNIVLIIMESFTAKLVEPLGGSKGVTPCFNELCKHGILFSNLYSSDSRTDKGLATVLSGYPVLESIPILKYPDKTIHLPYLTQSLVKDGYHASFHYGGDIDFANMKSYLVNAGFQPIVTKGAFPSSERTGKWGVPDHFIYDRFFRDIQADTGKWFNVLLTLSNHEPFEIPVRQKFGNEGLTEKFHSSAYYADSCLGVFIRKFKEAGLWENSVIILVADHGVRIPDYSEVYEPRKFHIPLLITGGAVNKDTVVSKMGSQADIAVTLLDQLHIDTDGYLLGKDLLARDSKSFVVYSYKNGIAMLTDSSGFGYDYSIHNFSFKYGRYDKHQLDLAKAQQQYVYQNYLDLSKKISRQWFRK
jgi:phosphoglycerol transferase MdoB-like AlkP superfamily enzyme